MRAKVIRYKTGEEIATCIEELIINKHGAPQSIMTDSVREFKSACCSELAKKYNIDWKFASAFHHITMSCIERANQSLWRKIRKLSIFRTLSWKHKVKEAVYCMNRVTNRSLGTSPYIFRYDREPILDCDLKHEIKEVKVSINDIRGLQKKVSREYEREKIKGKKEIKYDLEVGDAVWA